jgi:hypothetical protein
MCLSKKKSHATLGTTSLLSIMHKNLSISAKAMQSRDFSIWIGVPQHFFFTRGAPQTPINHIRGSANVSCLSKEDPVEG